MPVTRKGIGEWLFNSPRPARTPALGERERAVLEVLWHDGQLSAQDVLAAMGAAGIGLSTVQSTLERLHRKGLLVRTKAGRAYVYKATVTKSAIISSLLRDIADDLAGGDTAPMISGFMEYIGEQPDDAARDLTANAGSAEQDANDE